MLRLYMSQANKLPLAILLLLFVLPLFRASPLQLGDGTRTNSTVFIKVMDDVEDVYCTDFYETYAVKRDGSLWGTGKNLFVNGKRVSSDTFIKLMDDVLFFDGTLLLRKDGSLWSLPSGKTEFIPIARYVKKCSGSFYIKNDNTLWGYGYYDRNGRFRTVDGNGKNEICEPVRFGSGVKDLYSSDGTHLQIVTSDVNGAFFEMRIKDYNKGRSDNFDLELKHMHVRSLGEGHFFITQDDELFGFGFASYGTLGTGKLKDGQWKMPITKVMDDVKSVSTGISATLIVKNDGALYGCGGAYRWYSGELGLGNLNAYWTPQYIMSGVVKASVGNQFSAIIKEDGSLWTCGVNNEEDVCQM